MEGASRAPSERIGPFHGRETLVARVPSPMKSDERRIESSLVSSLDPLRRRAIPVLSLPASFRSRTRASPLRRCPRSAPPATRTLPHHLRASPWAAACLHAQAAAAPSNQPAQSRAAAAPASQPAEATCLPGRRRRPTFLCPSRQQEIPNGSQGLVDVFPNGRHWFFF